jgi:hypothetical protein
MSHFHPTAKWTGCADCATALGSRHTIIKDSINYPIVGPLASFNTSMNRPRHLALAAAPDASAVPRKSHVTPGAETDDPSRPIQGRAADGRVARLQDELVDLRRRCRARELALAHMAGAIAKLQRANAALNDENRLLREQLRGRTSERPAERWSDGRRHLAASDA